MLLLWAPKLFLTLYSFASLLNACLKKKKKLQVQHIKTSMTRSHNIQITVRLCSSSLALIILFRLGFQTYANELGIWKEKEGEHFQLLLMNLYLALL